MSPIFFYASGCLEKQFQLLNVLQNDKIMTMLGNFLLCNTVGREAIEGLRFLASLPRAGAGREKRNLSIRSIPVCILEEIP